jgi:class 3 adenylate cyclase
VRPAKVLMSQSTRHHVPNGMTVAASSPMLLKGAREPQAIFELETA